MVGQAKSHAHSFTDEQTLTFALKEALVRDERLAMGEAYDAVLPSKKRPRRMKKQGTQSPLVPTEAAAAAASATAPLAESAPPAPHPQQQQPNDIWSCRDCIEAGYGWSIKKKKCGQYANVRCPDHEL